MNQSIWISIYGSKVNFAIIAYLSFTRFADDKISWFYVAILDHQMPGMSGVDLGTRIRASSAPVRGIWLLLVSSEDVSLEVGRRKLEVFDRILRKPLAPLNLLSALCPANVAETRMATPQPSSSERLHSSDRSLSVLVAEDNAVNQLVVMGALKNKGHMGTVAANGREALELFAAGDFDAIFMDIEMPVMDGFAATKRIRRTDKGRNVPIYAMTAHVVASVKQRMDAVGFAGYLFKPLDFAEMSQTLDALSVRLDREDDPFDVPDTEADRPGVDADWVQHPLLDVERFDDLAKVLQADAFSSVVDGFLEAIPATLEKLLSASDDVNHLVREAHTLKGLSANIGAVRLARVVARVEEAAKLQGEVPVAEVVETLRAIAAETVTTIAERRARLS